MGTVVARGLAHLAALAALCLLAACASRIAAQPHVPGPTLVRTTVTFAGADHAAHWTVPEGEPRALLVLQHGFARRCDHLAGTSRHLAAAGLLVLCLDAPMAGGNPALADEMMAWLDGEPAAPGGGALPRRILVGGHSAGAVFAARLAASLARYAPARLNGLLMLDPVATEGLAADLRVAPGRVRVPVLAILATPHRCNAEGSARPLLARWVDAGAMTLVEAGEGSTHVDPEGDDTDWLGTAACGTPQPEQTRRWRDEARRWALDALEAG